MTDKHTDQESKHASMEAKAWEELLTLAKLCSRQHMIAESTAQWALLSEAIADKIEADDSPQTPTDQIRAMVGDRLYIYEHRDLPAYEAPDTKTARDALGLIRGRLGRVVEEHQKSLGLAPAADVAAVMLANIYYAIGVCDRELGPGGRRKVEKP